MRDSIWMIHELAGFNNLEIIEVLANKQLWKHQRRWRESFAAELKSATGKWVLDNFDWHIFSFDYCDCRSGARAEEEYLLQKYNRVIVTCGPEQDAGAICIGKSIRRCDSLSMADIYITDEHYTWTFVLTHEETMGLGPYFAYSKVTSYAS